MRSQLNKLTKGHSTKGERRFAELLKSLHIPFRTKVIIKGREVDFLIGKYAIEIDSHAQDVSKNKMLAESGYNPIHFTSWTIPNPHLIEWLKEIYGR
jgi:very-short-patch-repair endonuclease